MLLPLTGSKVCILINYLIKKLRLFTLHTYKVHHCHATGAKWDQHLQMY